MGNIKVNGLELVGHRWFTSRTTVGIVLCKNEIGEYKSYIGSGQGHDEEHDLKQIMLYGAKFPLDEAKSLIW